MKSESLRPATMALLLAVTILCAAVLAVLTLSTAAADLRLAEKYADTVRAEYTLEGEAAAWLSEAEAAVLRGEIAEGILEKTVGDEAGRHLEIALAVKGNTYTVERWQLVAPDSESVLDNLWKQTA